MKTIDMSTWKPFRVGELFEISGSKTTPKMQLDLSDDGKYPYVTTQATDNGVFGYSDQYTEAGGVLTVDSAVIGTCFYQRKAFTASDHVEKLTPRFEMSNLVGLFLSCVMTKYASYYDYSYAQKRSQTALREEVIMLPTTSDGEPDWAYMETYMQQVLDREEIFAEHLASLTAEAVADGHVVDTSAWKAFHLYDVFDIDMGNKFDRGKMPIGDAVNFVGRTGLNNGVNAVCGYVDGVSPYASGLITLALGGTIGACFVQTAPFYTSQNVVVLIPPEHVGLYGRLFASSSIYASATSRYKAFSDELNRHVKSDFTFMLPATPDGEPDWAYMEQYMKDVMAVEALFADELDRVYCA